MAFLFLIPCHALDDYLHPDALSWPWCPTLLLMPSFSPMTVSVSDAFHLPN
jgi:hypothetical protein